MAEKHIPRPQALKGYFELYGKPRVERNRLWVSVIALSAACALLALAIIMLSPLKTVVPYVVQVDAQGRVMGLPAPLRPQPASSAEKRYWIARWTRDMLSVEPVLTRRWLEEAYQMTRSTAADETLRFANQYGAIKRLTDDPNLRVTVHVQSVNFLAHGQAYVRALTTDSDSGATQEWALTLTYVLIPPKRVSDAEKNPLGLYFVNVSITEVS